MRRSIALLVAVAAPPLLISAHRAPVVQAEATFDRDAAHAAISALADEIEANFVFPDVAHRYADRLRERLAAGAYDVATDPEALAKMVTDDLMAVARDGHLRMRAPQPPRDAGAGDAPPRSFPPVIEQPGWIADGIAYIRFNAFLGTPEELDAFREFLDAHEGAKTLIIDARTHHGGGLAEMDLLLPRIFTKPQTVMVMDSRASVAEEQGELPFASLVKVPAPDDIARTEHRVTPQAQPDGWADTRIYYLTSGRTASAAEHLATIFKYTGRATLIGDTTAGAGNYGGTVDLPGGYSAFIPFGHSYFPGTQGWEGTGVAPDIAVAPAQALTEALVLSGVPREAAEALSASHVPGEPMVRRVPLAH